MAKAIQGKGSVRRVPSPSRSKMVAALDGWFSQWIRSKDADHAGRVPCFTCGVIRHWKEMDAGHFQTRVKYSTRWDEMNVKPQCKGCNLTNGGHQYIFGLYLDQLYGAGAAEEVVRRSNELRKFSTVELREMAALYHQKVIELRQGSLG